MRFRIALINSCMAMQIYFGAVSDNLLIDYLYCIAGNFRKKKLSQIACWCHQKMPHAQISQRKLSQISHKISKFSPSRVSRYTVEN